MRFFVKFGATMAISTSLAVAGCMAQESGESLEEAAQAMETDVVTCNGGWPGTRPCMKRIGDGREIIPESVKVIVVGRDGSVGYSVPLTENNRVIAFSATIHEGDMFNPGKNTTSFLVLFEYR